MEGHLKLHPVVLPPTTSSSFDSSVCCINIQVDHQEYITPAAFLADAHLIVRCAEELYGHPEEAAGTGAGFASAAAQHAGTSAAAAAAAGAAAGAGEGAVGDDAEAGAADAAAGAAGPDHVEAGNDPGQQAEDTGPAAAARAAAAAAGPQVQQVHPLPAVRVAVCKEISRATELKVSTGLAGDGGADRLASESLTGRNSAVTGCCRTT